MLGNENLLASDCATYLDSAGFLVGLCLQDAELPEPHMLGRRIPKTAELTSSPQFTWVR